MPVNSGNPYGPPPHAPPVASLAGLPPNILALMQATGTQQHPQVQGQIPQYGPPSAQNVASTGNYEQLMSYLVRIYLSSSNNTYVLNIATSKTCLTVILWIALCVVTLTLYSVCHCMDSLVTKQFLALLAMSLAQLPPEIYSAVLEQIPPQLLQATTFTLLCATPASPIPLHHLYQCVRIVQPKQLVLLDRRLRSAPQFIPWIHELSIESWNVDADVVVNLVRKLQPYVLRIYVGPKNFSPEHLEEMLHFKLGQRLKQLEIRFNP